MSLSFTVDLGEPERKIRPPPARLRNSSKTKFCPTRDDLEKKQNEAEKRRKEQEQMMIKRVREVREECRNIDHKVQKLLQQDAKRKGLPGSSDIKAMSRAEAKRTITEVSRDFENISNKICATSVTSQPSS